MLLKHRNKATNPFLLFHCCDLKTGIKDQGLNRKYKSIINKEKEQMAPKICWKLRWMLSHFL